MPEILDRHDGVLAAVRRLGTDATALAALSDDSLLQLTRLSGELSRAISANGALVAGEVDRRSTPSLGSVGLAQSAGYRTPQQLLRIVTGASSGEAAQAVAVGRIASGADERAWLEPVGSAVATGSLAPTSAQAIATGLDGTAGVSPEELTAAATQLCAEAMTLDADTLFKRARALRDELDDGGIAGREAARREQRSLRLFRRPNGMSRLTWEMDPETAALVGDVYDRATSPRRGGPRFSESPLAAQIADDPRSTDQLASDVFTQLLIAGGDADSSQLLGSGAPSVRVLVDSKAVADSAGHGQLEGQHDPVSIETVERLACAGSVLEITTRDGQPIDVGREQRLYTRRQRIALAARDGGCRWPDCDRPPSWTEAHHIHHWARDGGRTDVADGVLLCRHHHLLVHNNHWEIERRGSDYWLIPPQAGRDPVPMRDGTMLMRRA